MDIIRRMLVGETDQEICLDLGVSESRLSVLKNDPTFAAKLEEEGEKLHSRFIEQRMDAMEVIENAQKEMVELGLEAAKLGTINGRTLSPKDQLKSVWDILDRGGTKKAEKKIVAHANIADLVVEAYRESHGAGDPEAEQEPSNAGPSSGGRDGAASTPVELPPPSNLTDDDRQLSLFDMSSEAEGPYADNQQTSNEGQNVADSDSDVLEAEFSELPEQV